MKSETTLLGIRRFISKKSNKDCAVLQLSVSLTEAQKASGSEGVTVQELFVPEDLFGELSTLVIGKPVYLEYELGYGGRANLIGFRSVK